MHQELRKKIGQLFMVGFHGQEVDEHITRMILQQHVGGVILFRRNIDSPQQVSALCHRLQEINAQVSDTPLLIALDQEGGMVMRIEQGMTPMPSAMAFQAAGSESDCEQLHRISADEIRQIGVNMFLAPVLDVNNNPLNPVIGVRAFGETVAQVAQYGLAAMRGIRAMGMIATAKHFPGHGDTSTDTHYASAVVAHDKARLDAVELAPFKAAIAQGLDAIMTAHVMFPAIEPDVNLPATMSKAVLTDLLRTEMGFQGVVITDCLEMAAIADGIGFAKGSVASLQAGADIILISHVEAHQLQGIEAAFEAAQSGEIAAERIEQALQRVAQLKRAKAVGAWRERSLTPQGLMLPEALALAQKVQKAAVLVQGEFRPLDADKNIALITLEVRAHTEIDEVALGRNKEARSTMLPAMLATGLDVREYALSAQADEQDVDEAIAFAKGAQQIVLQTYNAMLVPGQQRLVAALPQEKLWLVAGRLPYDLDLAPAAQGRLASFGCRPAALLPVVEKLLGRAD